MAEQSEVAPGVVADEGMGLYEVVRSQGMVIAALLARLGVGYVDIPAEELCEANQQMQLVAEPLNSGAVLRVSVLPLEGATKH